MKGTAGKAFVVVAAILSLVMAASVGFAETIKVGVLLPLTGSQAKFGEIEKRSMDRLDDTDRDYILTALRAKEYGLIDEVISKRA